MLEPIINYNQKENQEKTIPVERNLTETALWLPNESRKVFENRFFSRKFTDENGKGCEIKIDICYHSTLGTLNTFDQRVYFCLVELWYSQERSQVSRFSLRQLAEMLNISWAGKKTAVSLEESLCRLRGVPIHWNGAFFDFSQNKYIHIKNPFTVLNHLVIVSTNEKAIRDKECEFSFDSHVVNNFLNNGTRPINRKIVQSLGSPIAQQLYILLDREMYGTNEYSILTSKLFEKLGLTAKRYKKLSNRIEVLQRIKSEIINQITSYNETFIYFEIESSKTKDKKLVVRRTGVQKIALSPEYLPRKLQIVPQTQNKASLEAKTPQPIEKGGLEKKSLRTQNTGAVENKPVRVKKPIQPKEELPPLAKQFIAKFCALFPESNSKTIYSSKATKTAVCEFVKQYDSKSLNFLDFAYSMAQNPEYSALLKANTPSRILKYKIRDDSLVGLWIARNKREVRYGLEQQKRELEESFKLWMGFENKHLEEFSKYIQTIIDSLSEEEKISFEVLKKHSNPMVSERHVFYQFAIDRKIKYLSFHDWAYKHHREEYLQFIRYDISREGRVRYAKLFSEYII